MPEIPQQRPMARSSQPIGFAGRRVARTTPTAGNALSVRPNSRLTRTPFVDHPSSWWTAGLSSVSTNPVANNAAVRPNDPHAARRTVLIRELGSPLAPSGEV